MPQDITKVVSDLLSCLEKFRVAVQNETIKIATAAQKQQTLNIIKEIVDSLQPCIGALSTAAKQQICFATLEKYLHSVQKENLHELETLLLNFMRARIGEEIGGQIDVSAVGDSMDVLALFRGVFPDEVVVADVVEKAAEIKEGGASSSSQDPTIWGAVMNDIAFDRLLESQRQDQQQQGLLESMLAVCQNPVATTASGPVFSKAQLELLLQQVASMDASQRSSFPSSSSSASSFFSSSLSTSSSSMSSSLSSSMPSSSASSSTTSTKTC